MCQSVVVFGIGVATAAGAIETDGRVGDVVLLGLARDVVWPNERAGYGYTLACALPDGTTLAVRDRPDAGGAVSAQLDRFTTVEVDTSQRQGGWVRVIGADKSFDTRGFRRAYTSLLVDGWASDDYLCAYGEG